MSIEFVDPQAIEAEVKSQPKPEPRPESEIVAKSERREKPKLLVEIDERLDRSLSHLERQVDRMHDLNTRLFGSAKARSENQKNKNGLQNKGLMASIDERMAEFESLLAKLEEEVAQIDSLA